jgi:DNA-binding NarL/FixJ family response regulator
LVDDEPWALKGLSEIIPWNEYGFELCGYCRNTAEALAVFKQKGADAVFTDIRMPGAIWKTFPPGLWQGAFPYRKIARANYSRNIPEIRL